MSYYRQGPYRPSGPIQGIGVPRLTPAVKAIMIACVAMWLLQLLALGVLHVDLIRYLGVVPGLLLGGMLWQPLTYMFLHSPSDPFHLLFNMLILWMFGGELEQYWGSRGFLVYYLMCGVGGGLSAAALGLLAGGVGWVSATVGASGALFGLLVAFGIIYAERTVLFMMVFPMRARTMALILAGLNFFYLLGQPGSKVSHIAHLGGGLTGLIYLKRLWRVGTAYRELRWRLRRRKFRTIAPDDDRWIN